MDPALLLSWFERNARTLPWRDAPAGERDPYRVLVSEVMLQQTRVETVLRYYEPFLRALPDITSLADAREDDLMKRWEGLGYYRRARLLQQSARAIIAAGGFPRSATALAELPGFGPYTAGAVASLAFGERAAAIDGNVLRVFARQVGYDDDITAPAAKAAARSWVDRHQPRAAAGAFNEALMELGATVCTPRAPACGACPIAASCRAQGDRLPRKSAREQAPRVRVALALARRGDRVLLEKRERGLLAGTWGLPWVEGGAEALRERVEALTGGGARVGKPAARGTHVFTHRVWEMTAFEVETDGREGAWVRPDDVALGSAHRKILRRMDADAPAPDEASRR